MYSGFIWRAARQIRAGIRESLRDLPEAFSESHRIEVIDVLKEPLRALAEAILVTPTLVKLSPLPEQQIIGDLSEEEEVFRALGLPQRHSNDQDETEKASISEEPL